MTLNTILVTVGMIALFAAVIGFITKEGGWQDNGCNGNCSNCGSGCAQRPKSSDDNKTNDKPHSEN